MADNKLTAKVTAIDIVFDDAQGRWLSLPAIERAKPLKELLGMIAEREITVEEDESSPWSKNAAMREAYVRERTFTHVVALEDVIGKAKMLLAMEMADDGWYDASGEWRTLTDVFAFAMPDDAARQRSGSARQLAAFVETTVPTLQTYGISPEEIAACYRSGMPSIIRYVGQYVNHAMRKVDEDDLPAEFRIILTAAQTAPSISAFVSAMKERYRDPDAPPPPKALYDVEHSPTGERVRFAAEMDAALFDVFFRRNMDILKQAPGPLFAAVTPALVEEVLLCPGGGEWDASEIRLMRAAITGDWARSICLDALDKRGGEWVEITDITNVSDIPTRAVKRAMAELCRYKRNGWLAFADRHESEERWRLT